MAQQLNILCVITNSRPGGAQEAMIRLAAELRTRGHETTVWALWGPPEQSMHTLVGAERPKLRDYLNMVVSLFRLLKANQPDAVVTFLPLACIIGQIAAKFTGVKARIASQRNPDRSTSAGRPVVA